MGDKPQLALAIAPSTSILEILIALKAHIEDVPKNVV